MFICLVFNPFILDFLIASRGYSLALGLLMAAVALQSRELVGSGKAGIVIAMDGCCFEGLPKSVGSGESRFAFLSGAVLAAFLVSERVWQQRDRWRINTACIGSLFLAALIAGGSGFFEVSRNRMYFGAHHFADMLNSLVQPTLFQVNPELINRDNLPHLAWDGRRNALALCRRGWHSRLQCGSPRSMESPTSPLGWEYTGAFRYYDLYYRQRDRTSWRVPPIA